MAFNLIKAQPVRDLIHEQHLVASKKFLEKLNYEIKQIIINASDRAKRRHRKILWCEDFF